MSDTSNKPTVLIVGAGLAGLMLGALLERANIPYTIFERAAVVKSLGIYEEFLTVGKYLSQSVSYKESTMESFKPADYSPVEEFTGYGHYTVPRPQLHGLILRQVPAHKIHYGKRVHTVFEKDDKVMIQVVDDDTTYVGDILVGADGAYSAVRQQLYQTLKKEGKLPMSDHEDLPFSCTCLVGQTSPLDPEEFPIVKEPICESRSVLGKDKPYTWIISTTAQNTLSWMIIYHLNKRTNKAAMDKKPQSSKDVGWGPYAAQAMCEDTRNFLIPIGDGKSTLGDLFDRTPKDLISRVMLEEKVFKTWYSGRTVLLGDGAVTAMHDAVAMANLLYALPSNTSSEITKLFEEYYTERLPAVTESYDNSQLLSKAMEKGAGGKIALFVSTHLPKWLWRKALQKTIRYRPQIGYMEPVELKGTVVPSVSPSTEKARAAFEKQQQAATV
ncbi:hypothetical protein BGX23_003105 [Mortierella sp. AD031]|nr:hypothetical protein BGX23_003105 [Mortierella sp. AD031]